MKISNYDDRNRRLTIKPLTCKRHEKFSLNDKSLEIELNLNKTSPSISPELKETFEKTILPNVAGISKNYFYPTLLTVITKKKDNKMVCDLCFVGIPNAGEGGIKNGYETYDI